MPRKPPYRPTRGPRRSGPKVTREQRDWATAPKVRYVKPSRPRISGSIADLDVAPQWTSTPNPPDAVEGENYFYDLRTHLNTGFEVVITSTGAPLPPGIVISGLTLTGTPTAAGSFTGLLLTATNNSGTDESNVFDITIDAFAWTSTPTPPAGTVGISYNYDMAPHLNSTEGVSLSTFAGTLPAGLAYSGTRIVGTPTTEETQAGIQTTANNGTASANSAAYSIAIALPVPAWTTNPPAIPDGINGVAYNYDFAADLNTTLGVTVTETGAGSLPTGLSIAGTVMSGTPTVTGSYPNLQFTATNTAGSDQSSVTSMDIAPAAPNWDTTPNPPDGVVGVAYNYDFTSDLNTTEGVVLTNTGGPLPAGLSISGLTLTGTPTTEALYGGLQITATNVTGSDESAVFDINIAAAVTTAVRLDNPVQGGKEVLDQGTEVFSGELTAPGVVGTIAHDEEIIISTLSAENFGTKPRGPKPRLVWRASDQSLNPNATLGEATTFNKALAGDFVTSPAAVNSSHSFRCSLGWDNNQSSHLEHLYSTTWQKSYVFTRHRHNFDDDSGKAYRVRTKSGDPANISVGNWARSRTAPNATGRYAGNIGTTLYFDNDQGSISYLNEGELFGGAGDHTLDFYATQSEAETGSGTILETFVDDEAGSSVPFKTLNNKQCRHGSGVSTFYSIDNSGGAAVSFSGLSEPNYLKSNWVNGNEPSFGYQPDQWLTAETLQDMGTLDTTDGVYAMYRDGILAYTDVERFMLLESGVNTQSFDQLVQNGADAGQLNAGSYVYNDYAYYEDSWYYVLLTDEQLVLNSTVNTLKREHQPCPPTAWGPTEVRCILQEGQHPTLAGKWINVVVDGVVETSRQIN